MFQKLQYILLFVVFVISIFFVVSTLTFTGRLAEGSFSSLRYLVTIWHLMLHLCRLRGEQLEGPLVAPGRLAIPPLLLRIWGYRLPVAAIGQQQQMSCFRYLSYSSGPDYQPRYFTLLMSDELAQDEEDAEDYDLDAIERRTDGRRRDDDEATLVGGRGASSVNEDVVFEIGDEDAHDLSDDEDAHKSRHTSTEHAREDGDHADERVGFLSGGQRARSRDD